MFFYIQVNINGGHLDLVFLFLFHNIIFCIYAFYMTSINYKFYHIWNFLLLHIDLDYLNFIMLFPKDNSTKNMLSFYYFYHTCTPTSLALNKAHMNQYDTTFCINGFHIVKTFHNYLCKVELDLYKLFFIFQSKILLFYGHMDSILIFMDL